MRICILNEFFYPDDGGGTGTVLSELARHLYDGHEDLSIDVLTSQNLYREDTEVQKGFEDWNGIKITRLRTPKPNGRTLPVRSLINLLFSFAAFWHLLWRKYDVLLVTTAPPMAPFAAIALKKLKRMPYIYTVYDLEPDRANVMNVMPLTNPLAKMLKRCQKVWLEEASKVIVLGRCMKEHICDTYRLNPSKVDVVQVGADPDVLKPGVKHTQFRKQNGLEGFVALYSGNFGRYHNFDTVLDAAKILRTMSLDMTFVLVGGGMQKAHIVDRVESEKITNVRIFPFVPHEEYSDLLASADVSLVTLEPGMEGICVPSKFYSILASARPTIAMVGESCEVARVIQEAGCGVQIEQRDVNGLVDAICSLKDNPLDVDLMGANARDVLLEKFSTALLSDKYYRAFAMASGSGSVDPHVGTDRDFAWAVHSKDSNNGARKSSASKETAEAELVPDKL